jgi:hypothetical protein
MNSENDVLRDQLLALMDFRHLDLPEYWADPVAAARVGRVLTDAAARVPVRPAGYDWR